MIGGGVGLGINNEMIHHQLYLELKKENEEDVRLILSYTVKGLFAIDKQSTIKEESDKCKEDGGIEDLTAILKPNFSVGEIFKFVYEHQARDYSLTGWNCQDYTKALKEILTEPSSTMPSERQNPEQAQNETKVMPNPL